MTASVSSKEMASLAITIMGSPGVLILGNLISEALKSVASSIKAMDSLYQLIPAILMVGIVLLFRIIALRYWTCLEKQNHQMVTGPVSEAAALCEVVYSSIEKHASTQVVPEVRKPLDTRKISKNNADQTFQDRATEEYGEPHSGSSPHILGSFYDSEDEVDQQSNTCKDMVWVEIFEEYSDSDTKSTRRYYANMGPQFYPNESDDEFDKGDPLTEETESSTTASEKYEEDPDYETESVKKYYATMGCNVGRKASPATLQHDLVNQSEDLEAGNNGQNDLADARSALKSPETAPESSSPQENAERTLVPYQPPASNYADAGSALKSPETAPKSSSTQENAERRLVLYKSLAGDDADAAKGAIQDSIPDAGSAFKSPEKAPEYSSPKDNAEWSLVLYQSSAGDDAQAVQQDLTETPRDQADHSSLVEEDSALIVVYQSISLPNTSSGPRAIKPIFDVEDSDSEEEDDVFDAEAECLPGTPNEAIESLLPDLEQFSVGNPRKPDTQMEEADFTEFNIVESNNVDIGMEEAQMPNHVTDTPAEDQSSNVESINVDIGMEEAQMPNHVTDTPAEDQSNTIEFDNVDTGMEDVQTPTPILDTPMEDPVSTFDYDNIDMGEDDAQFSDFEPEDVDSGMQDAEMPNPLLETPIEAPDQMDVQENNAGTIESTSGSPAFDQTAQPTMFPQNSTEATLHFPVAEPRKEVVENEMPVNSTMEPFKAIVNRQCLKLGETWRRSGPQFPEGEANKSQFGLAKINPGVASSLVLKETKNNEYLWKGVNNPFHHYLSNTDFFATAGFAGSPHSFLAPLESKAEYFPKTLRFTAIHEIYVRIVNFAVKLANDEFFSKGRVNDTQIRRLAMLEELQVARRCGGVDVFSKREKMYNREIGKVVAKYRKLNEKDEADLRTFDMALKPFLAMWTTTYSNYCLFVCMVEEKKDYRLHVPFSVLPVEDCKVPIEHRIAAVFQIFGFKRKSGDIAEGPKFIRDRYKLKWDECVQKAQFEEQKIAKAATDDENMDYLAEITAYIIENSFTTSEAWMKQVNEFRAAMAGLAIASA